MRGRTGRARCNRCNRCHKRGVGLRANGAREHDLGRALRAAETAVTRPPAAASGARSRLRRLGFRAEAGERLARMDSRLARSRGERPPWCWCFSPPRFAGLCPAPYRARTRLRCVESTLSTHLPARASRTKFTPPPQTPAPPRPSPPPRPRARQAPRASSVCASTRCGMRSACPRRLNTPRPRCPRPRPRRTCRRRARRPPPPS